MQVILFRHGHKEFSIDEDPNLSPKGFDQAKNLKLFIESNKLPKPTHCWFSEKKRTRQTLANAFGESLIFEKSDLNYCEQNEDHKKMSARVANFINEISARKSTSEVHYICTHYDWIELAMNVIDCDKDLTSYEFSSWAPGQFIVFDVTDGFYTFIKKGSI